MLLRGFGVIALAVGTVLCLLLDAFVGYSWLWLLPLGFVGSVLLGLLACRAWDRKRWAAMVGWIVVGALTLCDYGSLGVCTVLLFHIFRGQKLAQLLMLIAINWFGFEGQQLILGTMEVPVQAFAILAIIPIFLYNVHHIDSNHNRNSKLDKLGCKVKVSLKIGCIHNVHNDIRHLFNKILPHWRIYREEGR